MLDVNRQGDAVIVTPHGRISEIEAHELERELLRHVEAGVIRLVLDLHDVPFLTSSSLGAFMLAHKRVHEQGGYVRLVRPQPLVRQIIETTKLTKLFGIYGSAEEALETEG